MTMLPTYPFPDRVALALDGGMPSAVLALWAKQCCGAENVKVYSLDSPLSPIGSIARCERMAEELGLAHGVIRCNWGNLPEELLQPCYFKRERLTRYRAFVRDQLISLAKLEGFAELFDASLRAEHGEGEAARELLLHPFVKAGYSWDQVKNLGRQLGLRECYCRSAGDVTLIERIAPGMEVTKQDIDAVRKLEYAYQQLGWTHVRVELEATRVLVIEKR